MIKYWEFSPSTSLVFLAYWFLRMYLNTAYFAEIKKIIAESTVDKYKS